MGVLAIPRTKSNPEEIPWEKTIHFHDTARLHFQKGYTEFLHYEGQTKLEHTQMAQWTWRCLWRVGHNGKNQNVLGMLPDHTARMGTGRKTGTDVSLYCFFLVPVLFLSIVSVVCSPHCESPMLMGVRNSKQLCWHNPVVTG